MTAWIIFTACMIYVIGFMLVFAMHTETRVTLGLALMRSTLWPVWLTSGCLR